MQRIEEHDLGQPPMFDFGKYLRTGKRVVIGGMGDDVEVKFNPWHDPDDGRFTFVGQGRFYGAGGQTWRGDKFSGGGGGSFGGGGASGTYPWPDPPKKPRTQRVSDYTVRAGDSLSRIAARRPGVTVTEIARLNRLDISRPLQIGQQLRLPEPERSAQAPGRADAATRWSVAGQLASERYTISKNGYRFQIDGLPRPLDVKGEITLGTQSPRSRRNQLQAGGSDRLPSDDGGHFIAVRLNGPREWFNHFAQDANFNRGAYRALENGWVKAKREGKSVFLHIVPSYPGLSRRPEKLRVTWYIDGKRHYRDFPNRKGGR